MSNSILDDQHALHHESSSTFEKALQKLKVFCTILALVTFAINYALVLLIGPNGTTLGISSFPLLLGFPYALMFSISTTIQSQNLYPNPWIESSNTTLSTIVHHFVVFLGWNILSPVIGGLGFFFVSLPIGLVAHWVASNIFQIENPFMDVYSIFIVLFLIIHPLWIFFTHRMLKKGLVLAHKNYINLLKD